MENKEQKKFIWMKQNFIEECRKMLELIEIQKLKVREELMKNEKNKII